MSSLEEISVNEKVFLKKHLKQLFYFYLESETASDTKDRNHKLYTFLELEKLLNTK